MKIAALVGSVVVSFCAFSSGAFAENSLYDLQATRIDGSRESLSHFKGKVALVVNTASECGYTPQYAELQELYARYKDRGFVVLGFPSNDFGGQEPGTEADIQKFCSSKFGVSFPLFSKTKVLGEGKDPIYQFLVASTGGKDVGWNFEKFLVSKDGLVLERFPSSVKPLNPALTEAVERAIGK
jgi:glutathione peroxidase